MCYLRDYKTLGYFLKVHSKKEVRGFLFSSFLRCSWDILSSSLTLSIKKKKIWSTCGKKSQPSQEESYAEKNKKKTENKSQYCVKGGVNFYMLDGP